MSPKLPPSLKFPIEHLAACFNRVTNSYKFYWLLSILESFLLPTSWRKWCLLSGIPRTISGQYCPDNQRTGET